MQITLKDRETISGVISTYTRPIDVSSMPLFTYNLTVHAASASTTFTGKVQSSDNLEDWTNVGSGFAQNDVGSTLGGKTAVGRKFGRYIRFQLTTGGTDPTYTYSLWVNAFPDS